MTGTPTRNPIDAHTDMARYVSGPYNLNTYLLTCRRTGESVIIDPGGTSGHLVSLIQSENIVPVKILNTHGHADQFFSTASFKTRHPVPSCLHADDNRFFSRTEVQQETYREIGLPPPYPADIEFTDDQMIPFGNAALKVLHTPGHTPGSVCFLAGGHLFTGDTLFPGEAGRTDLPGGDIHQLIRSIKDRILPLDKKTVVHPGHHRKGEKFESTIGREMKENIYIKDFILDP